MTVTGMDRQTRLPDSGTWTESTSVHRRCSRCQAFELWFDEGDRRLWGVVLGDPSDRDSPKGAQKLDERRNVEESKGGLSKYPFKREGTRGLVGGCTGRCAPCPVVSVLDSEDGLRRGY